MRAKIFEYNPNTDVMRWRYEDESHDDFGWPNYGRVIKKKKKQRNGEFGAKVIYHLVE